MITCYLRYAKLTHNDISLDTYFISPKLHGGALLGGWWYAEDVGAKLSALNQRALDMITIPKKGKPIATPRLGLEQVRAIGRELAGDLTGSSLTSSKTMPPVMARWLQTAGGDDALEEYRAWMAVLKSGFGPRRFVELELSADQVYGDEDV